MRILSPIIASSASDGFVWPSPVKGKVAIISAQLAMLLEGIDWRAPIGT
jgi:hypothetical protein